MDIQRDILPLKNVMYRLALRITLNSQEAEDVVQDVIVKVWGMRDQMDAVGNLEAYIMRMTRNIALDRQKLKANNTESIEGIDFASENSIEKNIEKEERLQSIRDVMSQLPEKQRTAMQLRDFEGRNYKDIAQVMDVTEDQVKVYIFRARQFVKTRLTSFN